MLRVQQARTPSATTSSAGMAGWSGSRLAQVARTCCSPNKKTRLTNKSALSIRRPAHKKRNQNESFATRPPPAWTRHSACRPPTGTNVRTRKLTVVKIYLKRNKEQRCENKSPHSHTAPQDRRGEVELRDNVPLVVRHLRLDVPKDDRCRPGRSTSREIKLCTPNSASPSLEVLEDDLSRSTSPSANFPFISRASKVQRPDDVRSVDL